MGSIWKGMGSVRKHMGSVGKPMGSMREALGSVFFIMFNFSFGTIGTIWVLLGNFEIF